MQNTHFTNWIQFKNLETLHTNDVELCLSYCGMEQCAPGHGFGPATRANYVVHVIENGKGIFQVNGKTFRLGKGDSFVIYPDVMTYYEADAEEPWNYFWIGFKGIKAYECVTYCGFTPERPIGTFHCLESLRDCLTGILEAYQLTYANELKRSGLTMQFLALMVEDYTANHPHQQTDDDYSGVVYVKHAVEYLSKNYNRKIKISDLAKYIGVNRSYLTNTFKQTMKISPHQFLLNLRLEKAASLLQNTDLPIQLVSRQVGYDDSGAFSKLFKKRYGVSPKLFRQSLMDLITTDSSVFIEGGRL